MAHPRARARGSPTRTWTLSKFAFWQTPVLGSVQVLHQQVFSDSGPPIPPCVSSASLDPPPPLICWRNTWIEGELLDDLYDAFQIIQICFSIIIRNRFFGVGVVFKDIRAWFRNKFISLLIISSILQQYFCYVSTLSLLPFKVSALKVDTDKIFVTVYRQSFPPRYTWLAGSQELPPYEI